MQFRMPLHRALGRGLLGPAVAAFCSTHVAAQREVRLPPAVQAFDAAECRGDCSLDSLSIDLDRGRRAQAGVVLATLTFIDTIALPKRGAPPPPRERSLAIWTICDSTPCGATVISGKLAEKRIDDARVTRKTIAIWTLPAPLLHRILRTTVLQVVVDGRVHVLSPDVIMATRALVSTIGGALGATTYSPRAALYAATFATFGVPGDSVLAEDVGTATEALMIPDPATKPPTRVATLTLAGRGPDALPLLVQDDATGAAPIFGVGESVTIALPGRSGRRGIVQGKVAARQRVEAFRDACQGTKAWTYLVALTPADLAAAQRGMLPSPRPGEGIDRWNGTAVREAVASKVTAAEQRLITSSRGVVAQFVRERAASTVRDRDVQVLAALPKNAGYITNFGLFVRDRGRTWSFPSLNLRPATCP